MPTYERLGTENREELQDRWKPAIYLDKEPSIMVRQPDATMQPTPQDNQLISKHRVLGFKPQLRLEWQGHDGQKETEQSDHSASLGDSITSSTRIRFSVHAGPKRGREVQTEALRPRQEGRDGAEFIIEPRFARTRRRLLNGRDRGHWRIASRSRRRSSRLSHRVMAPLPCRRSEYLRVDREICRER